jgi:galactokinase
VVVWFSRMPTHASTDLRSRFIDLFGREPALYRAPGRVNLIGEHTDYNEGFVLPAAIGFSCWVAGSRRADQKLVIHSGNMNETVESRMDSGELKPTGGWADYPLGVAWALREGGYPLAGANLFIQGDVPLGSGLSSSAALEVSVAFALLDLSCQPINRTRVAELCRRAENEFVGTQCGIMDQFISCHGLPGHGLLLDCRSLNFRTLPLRSSVRLGICNTMVKHELSAGEYNLRRKECEEAVHRLGHELPGLRSLRDITSPELDAHRSSLTDTLYRRSRHVVSENERTLKAAEALERGDMHSFGQLAIESHRSLRDDYAVSCDELDLMVELALGQEGVYGARMTGGGFGGCTINFLDARCAAEFRRAVAEGYFKATGRRPEIYVCEASDGAQVFAPASAAI